MRKRTYILYVHNNNGLNQVGTAGEAEYEILDKKCADMRKNGENAFIWEI